MGFGFNLIGFPILVASTIVLLVYYLASKKKIALFLLSGLLLMTTILITIGIISDYLNKPIQLTKQSIIGEYRIDTTFYPGKNASWQYKHYKFYITKTDSILFVVMNDNDEPFKIYSHKIAYSNTRNKLWSIIADSTNKVISNQPILFRGHDNFYYVFKTKPFGNMFFRKTKRN